MGKRRIIQQDWRNDEPLKQFEARFSETEAKELRTKLQPILVSFVDWEMG
jgi:hypothetical protein